MEILVLARRMGIFVCLVLLTWRGGSLRAGDADKYALGPQLKVLAADVKNPVYRKLVLEKMLITDLAAEWQRVATADNPESFLKKHGGRAKVLADPLLKRAYQRRVKIRDDFLELMRQGYKRYKEVPPFDRGAKAEPAGTEVRKAGTVSVHLEVVLPAPGAIGQWPCFRGPTGQGETKALPTAWDKNGKNILWRMKVPDRGNSSPIIWGAHIFLTTATEKGIERALLCFRLSDGKLLWRRRAPDTPPEPQVRDKNGFASSTPVTDGERVIAFLGSCGLVCCDFKGNLLWHHGDVTIRTTHGTGSSPLLYKDLVILVQDQNQADSIFLALDKRTGKRVWQGKRGPAMTWSTPVVVRVGGRDELLVAGAETVKAYDPASGKELWSLRGPTFEVIPALVVGKDMIYSASGRNGPIVAFRPGGSGDVTNTHLVWRTVRAGPHVPSPVLVNGRLYVANDTGIVSCLDATTGKLIYQGRLNDRFSASPVVAGGLIYFSGESGVTYIVRAGDRLDVVAENDLGSPILASPASVNGLLVLRTEDELVCIGRPKADKTIRFEAYRNLIFLPVSVNGSKPLSFVLDSGSGTGIIDRARAREVGLKFDTGGQGIGAGDGTFDYDLAKDVSLRFAGMDVSVAAVKVVDLSSFRLVFGRPVDGTLGYPVFARYVVVVDNEKHKLSFFNPKTYVYTGRGEKIPLTIKHNVPYVTAKLKVYGQDAVERNFMIDTGLASTTVADGLIAKTSSRKIEVITGVGLGKERKGIAARVEKLQLGSFAIEHAYGRTGKWSVIGGGILSRFNMVFDYNRRLVILDPNSRFGDPYPYDASGIVLRLTQDLKHFRVHAVLPDSPAAEAGLRPEDTITAIDGRHAAQFDLTEVQHLFKQTGKQHRLHIRRGDKQWQLTIKLRKLL